MSLWSLIVKVKGDNSGLKTTLNDSEKQVGKFGAALKQLGTVLAAAFAVDRVVAFGKEVILLAAKAEGVRAAFSSIGGGKYLDDLREATRGTVDDLRLMQAAVQANNFQIPLQSLASLFKFAADRAMQTGQSVDYLVDSIILGIGRKSPLILDNLGISAVRLREVLKGAGVEMSTVGDIATAVGKIASDEMQKMGDIADTASTKITSITTAITNLKTAIGTKLNSSGFFNDVLMGASIILNKIAPKNESKFEGMSSEQLATTKTELEAKRNELFSNIEDTQWMLNRTTIKKDREQLQRDITEWERDIENVENDIKEVERLIKDVERLKNSVATGIVDERVIDKGPSAAAIPGFSKGFTVAGKDSKYSLDKDNFGLRGFNAEIDRELTAMEQLLRSGVDMAASLGGQMAEALGEALGSGNLKDIGKQLLSSFAGFLSQFGQMLIAFGIAHSAFYESLTAGPLGGPIAIAAGVAAMAASGIIKGAMSKTASGGLGSVGSYQSGGGQMQNIKIQVEGKIKGKDIGIAMKRQG